MFYLYFVLPPIIIVISLALIIFLVFRKSLEIEKKIEEEGLTEEESKISMEIKSRGLYLLEKLAHWFKILSLRAHNWLEVKLKFIKQRKSKINLNKNDIGKKIETDNDKSEDSFKKKGFDGFEKREEKKRSFVGRVLSGFKSKKSDVGKIDEENLSVSDSKTNGFGQREMISKEAVYPEKERVELEKTLIERIAVDPRDIEAYERLGDYYISRKNYNDAKECYRQVLKLNPRSAGIKKKLENLLK